MPPLRGSNRPLTTACRLEFHAARADVLARGHLPRRGVGTGYGRENAGNSVRPAVVIPVVGDLCRIRCRDSADQVDFAALPVFAAAVVEAHAHLGRTAIHGSRTPAQALRPEIPRL